MLDLRELSGRIGEIAALYKTKRQAAAAAGISTDTLALYIKGQSKAPFAAMAGLAGPKGVSLDWLATAEGNMYSRENKSDSEQCRLDEELLQDVITAIEELLFERGVELTPAKKARAIALAFELFQEEGAVDRETVSQLIKLAA